MTSVSDFQAVAARHSREWPAEFLRLIADGVLDVPAGGDASADGDAIPLLRFSTSFELLDPTQIAKRLDMMVEPDDHRRIDPALGLLPFAMEAGGNLCCFLTQQAQGDSAPVVLLVNDEEEDEYLADDLAGFIFSDMVTSASEFYDDDPLGEGNPAENAQIWLAKHRQYMKPEQVSALENLFANPVEERDDDSLGFISYEDGVELITRVLGSGARDEELVLWERDI